MNGLPEGWDWVRLAEMVKFDYGFPFDSKLFNDEKIGKPLIRTRNLLSSKTDVYYSGDFDKTYLVKNDDILIGMDGEFNIVKWQGGEALLNQRICRLIVTEKNLMSEYVYRVLLKVLKELEDKTPSVTVKHLSAKQLNKVQIPIPIKSGKPDLARQTKIVTILDQADKNRQLHAQLEARLDEFLKSTFLEMFGDPVRNEKGWEKRVLGDLIIQGPYNGIYKSADMFGSGVNLIDNRCLFRGLRVDLSNLRKVQVTREELYDYSIQNDDVLINRVSVKPEGVGKAVWVEGIKEETVFESNMMRIKINQNLIISLYLVFYLNTPPLRSKIIQKSFVANQASINQKGVKSIQIILPPLPLQHHFAAIVHQTEALRSQFAQSKKEADDLFDALMQKAFTGELVV